MLFYSKYHNHPCNTRVIVIYLNSSKLLLTFIEGGLIVVKARLELTLDKEIKESLSELAKADHMSISQYVTSLTLKNKESLVKSNGKNKKK